MLRTFAGIYDRLDSSESHQRLERLVVVLAAAGFLLHLLLILLARTVPDPGTGILSRLDRNFLHAIYTPFSFILFYEVLMLVFALPKSHTSSIGKQYEIISLIVVRRVFKDIGEFRELESWLNQPEALRDILLDMGAAVLMFFFVTAFYRIRQTVAKSATRRHLDGFIQTKKAIAVLLGLLLVMLALFNLVTWTLSVLPVADRPEFAVQDADRFFFPVFFEFMIFTDVFLLIISISYYDRYEYVFRNAGFVISTILLRISLSTPKPYDLPMALLAMIYGIAVLAVFAFFNRVSSRQRDRHPGPRFGPARDPNAEAGQ